MPVGAGLMTGVLLVVTPPVLLWVPKIVPDVVRGPRVLINLDVDRVTKQQIVTYVRKIFVTHRECIVR